MYTDLEHGMVLLVGCRGVTFLVFMLHTRKVREIRYYKANLKAVTIQPTEVFDLIIDYSYDYRYRGR